MRVSFPNNEHPDVLIAPGDTGIGSAADNTIVLSAPGIAPHHARLSVSDRSIVLAARDAHARMHVNARPVVEKAILRLGDVVSLGTLKLVLKPDRDDSICVELPGSVAPAPAAGDAADGAPSAPQLPARVVLRGVSGAWFGRIVPVRGRLLIGRSDDCGLVLDEPEIAPHLAIIENVGDGIYLRGQGSSTGALVNGVPVRNAVLYSDDQIAFERNRFVLEAPSLPQRESPAPAGAHAVNITQTMRAIEKADAAPVRADHEPGRNDIWWLIGASTLIAAGVAVLLYLSF
ncbi:MAG: FHA domain-containing protein [Proteobacteria bacterium]|nr:FHA domain-containing protein [Pseudomonadota bacterium]